MRTLPSPDSDSMAGKAAAWYGSLPAATRWILTLCVGIFVFAVFVGYDNYSAVCMAPILFIRHYQIYRAFTSVVFHGGILHIAFNMLAFVPLGSSLEHTIGTVQFMHTIFLFCVVASLLHTIIGYAMAMSPVFAQPHEMSRCSIGFSGVIFGLIVVDTFTSSVRSRSIFGLFAVPSHVYPWALLFLFQIMMPNVSFLGHLSGLLAGLMYVYGLLSWIQLAPRTVAFAEAKWAQVMPAVVESHTFKMHPGTSMSTLYDTGNSSSSGGVGATGSALPWANPTPVNGSSTIGRIGNFFMGRGASNTEAFSGRGHRLGSGGSASGEGERAQGKQPIKEAHGPTIAKLPPSAHDGASSSGVAVGTGGSPNGAWQTGMYGPPSITLGDPNPTPTSNSKGKMPAQAKVPVYVSPENVNQLVDMGFEQGVAHKALEAANNDIPLAIEILT